MAYSIFELMRKQAESLYDKTADVYEYKQAEGVINNAEESLLYSSVPCRISAKNLPNGEQSDTTNNVSGTVKLFCSAGYKIPTGSKIVVSDGNTYISSGIPMVYISHQEIELINEVEKA